MQLARVIGRAIATVKHTSLVGQKLLILQPLLADGVSPDGMPLVAVDSLGAGRGDHVIVSSDGRAVRELVRSDTTPVRWSTIGVRD